MYGYIYKTTDSSNGKIYVGQHKSEEFDIEYKGSGIIIKRIINKRPQDLTTEVIEWCSTASELNEREIYWISTLDSTNKEIGYNISIGGNGTTGSSNSGKKRTDEQKLRISIATKNSMKKPEIRKKLSDANKGRCGEKNGFFGKQHTDEQKERWSKQRKGKQSKGSNPNAKVVINSQNGMKWECMKDCADYYGISMKVLRRWIRDHIKGLNFEKYDN